MPDQEVKHIKIKDLVLWTENPRDPISNDAKDQDIVDRAINKNPKKWKLNTLGREMGSRYDFSELPTVVYHGKAPVVYDGNRRIVLAKIKLGYVVIQNQELLTLPDFPQELPCNVCTKTIAFDHILRKHGSSGSWSPLERDIFLHKHMKQEKSLFLLIEDSTGLISAEPDLNKGFVKKEIFTTEIIKRIGFDVVDGKLHSRHNKKEAKSILSDIAQKVSGGELNTREGRGKIFEKLDATTREIIDANAKKKTRLLGVTFNDDANTSTVNAKKEEALRRTPRKKKNQLVLFGGNLYIRPGIVNTLYRDISDLYEYYSNNTEKLSDTFPNLIRMSLRLLCDVAAKDLGKNLDDYIKGNFERAKKELDKDVKTTLSNHNVRDNSIIQLLQTGAHGYQASANIEQMIAMSIIIGAILEHTHRQGAST